MHSFDVTRGVITRNFQSILKIDMSLKVAKLTDIQNVKCEVFEVYACTTYINLKKNV